MSLKPEVRDWAMMQRKQHMGWCIVVASDEWEFPKLLNVRISRKMREQLCLANVSMHLSLPTSPHSLPPSLSIHVCVCVCVCVCLSACLSLCVYMCMSTLCECICMCMFVLMHSFVCAHVNACVYKCMKESAFTVNAMASSVVTDLALSISWNGFSLWIYYLKFKNI